MAYADFIHLRTHTAYSLSEGAIKIDKLAALAKELKMPAVAITDTGNMFGSLEFSQYCSGKGVQPIIGCQLGLARPDNLRMPPDPLVLLAQNKAGFDNLQKLSSHGFLDTETGLKPQITLDLLAHHAEGLILLTGGSNGPIARLLAEGQRAEAERLLAALAEAFPDRAIVELHRHNTRLDRAIEPGLIALADAAGLPLVATNDCYFARREMHEAHDALLCIAEGRTLAERDRRRVSPENWFKPADQMRALFADLPEACDNTIAIAKMCAVMAETRKPLLPVCPKVREGQTEDETVRDVGRVLGLPYGQVNKVAELIPNNPAKPVTLQQAIDGEPKLQEMGKDDESVARLLDIALQLEGLYRHASTHAAGVVIGDRPLTELVPIYRDPKSDFLVTQFSMKYVEQAGLVKFDFLGLTTLTILQRALGYLKPLGIDIDLATVPLDDAPTYQMLQKGDAGGVFQFESQGMRDVLKQMRPDRLEDLIAAVALYRPGPMANIPAYCARKHGEAWEPPHPDIAHILGETYGIMVYQEQVMQIAQAMAGYSLGGADLLRRAMGKKIAAEMEQQRKIFTDGATARGVPPEKATEVFDLMAKFADYGFNKSHAAAYALVAYHTAYMKANHPEAFLAGCMSLALSNTDKLAALRQEASRMGIRVLPPDINRSGADFTLERDDEGKLCIRYALAAVKKVGQAAMEALVRTRGERPFADLADLAERIDPKQLNKMQIENLARAGAFDSIEMNRGRLFAGAESILRRAQARSEERLSGQIGLFGAGGYGVPTGGYGVGAIAYGSGGIASPPPPKAEPLPLPNIVDWDPMERLGYEADAIGFHLTAHPLDSYGAALRRIGAVPSNKLEDRAQLGAARVKVAGCVINSKERITRTGSRMAWVRLSDSGGSFEVTFFSETLGRAREMLVAGNAVLVTADIKLEGDSMRITAQDCEALDQAAARAGAGIRVWLAQTEAVPHIRTLLEREGRGRGRVVLVPQIGDTQEVEIPLPGGFNVTPRLAQALKLLAGVERVEDV